MPPLVVRSSVSVSVSVLGGLLVVLCVLVGACYSSHEREEAGADAGADAPGRPLADRYGIWAFSSCTGSGIFVVLNVCEGGAAQLQEGNLGSPVYPQTAGWSALDAQRIEVLGVRGGRRVLRWNADEGRWYDEDPIDACAESGFEPLRDDRDHLDRYASAMSCPD